MPSCKNDSKRFYTGNEPSPKGKGYCAHAEKIGTVKIGANGELWIVKSTSTGIKRWMKSSPKRVAKSSSSNPKEIAKFEKARKRALVRVTTPSGKIECRSCGRKFAINSNSICTSPIDCEAHCPYCGYAFLFDPRDPNLAIKAAHNFGYASKKYNQIYGK